MSLIKINNGLAINPNQIASLQLDSYFYMNGSDHYLVIEMIGGKTYRVKHDPQLGVNCYDLKEELEGVK